MKSDPVCGMRVKESGSPPRADYMGQTYYFCGLGCKKAFEIRPHKYLDAGYKPSMWAAFADWLRAVLGRG